MGNKFLENIETDTLVYTLLTAQKSQASLITKMTDHLTKLDPKFLNSLIQDFKLVNYNLELSHDRLSEYNAKKGKGE